MDRRTGGIEHPGLSFERRPHDRSRRPALTYHLVEVDGKPALFERDEKGKGVVISNHWTDSAGDHYYVGVTSNGWEYVFPQGGTTGSRIVYNRVQTQPGPDGSVRPTSQPMARCELVASAQ